MELNFSLEIKALEGRQFEGYGAVFNNLDLTGDVVAPGAFKATLAEHKTAGTLPLMLWMHKPDQVAGVWLSMREDSRGLAVKGELADTQLGNEIRTLLGIKAVRGLSIGFRTRDAEWIDDEERGVHRVIKEVDLVEVSVVSMAANPLAEVTASKSRLSEKGVYVPTVNETEIRLRQAGFSKSASRAMVAKIFGPGAMLGGEDDDKIGEMPDFAQFLKSAQALKVSEIIEPVKPKSTLIKW